VEHELEATTAPRAVRAQAAQPACELAIVKEVLPRDATAHRRRALAEMQVADDDETVGQNGCTGLIPRHASPPRSTARRYAGQYTSPSWEGRRDAAAARPAASRRRQSRTASASAISFTALWCSGVKPAGTSESTSSCPRMVRPRRIRTTNSDLVSRLQAR